MDPTSVAVTACPLAPEGRKIIPTIKSKIVHSSRFLITLFPQTWLLYLLDHRVQSCADGKNTRVSPAVLLNPVVFAISLIVNG
jgi:hypothetical protein